MTSFRSRSILTKAFKDLLYWRKCLAVWVPILRVIAACFVDCRNLAWDTSNPDWRVPWELYLTRRCSCRWRRNFRSSQWSKTTSLVPISGASSRLRLPRIFQLIRSETTGKGTEMQISLSDERRLQLRNPNTIGLKLKPNISKTILNARKMLGLNIKTNISKKISNAGPTFQAHFLHYLTKFSNQSNLIGLFDRICLKV